MATELSPINGEDDDVGGFRPACCCFAVHTLLASSRRLKALVSREGYVLVITANTGVHGTDYGRNYAERRNITAQASCEWDRFMGLPQYRPVIVSA